jgi:hypothetical protein
MGKSAEEFIERTGGFRFGESQTSFRARVTEIARLEESLMSGRHNMAELEAIQRRLCDLKGIDFDSYDDPSE